MMAAAFCWGTTLQPKTRGQRTWSKQPGLHGLDGPYSEATVGLSPVKTGDVLGCQRLVAQLGWEQPFLPRSWRPLIDYLERQVIRERPNSLFLDVPNE